MATPTKPTKPATARPEEAERGGLVVLSETPAEKAAREEARAERKARAEAMMEEMRETHEARKPFRDAMEREWFKDQAEQRRRQAELEARLLALEAMRIEAERREAEARAAALKEAVAESERQRQLAAAEAAVKELQGLRQQIGFLQGEIARLNQPLPAWAR